VGYAQQLLDDVRAQLAPDDAALKEARERRDLARSAGESFRGTNRSFTSGSLAHGTLTARCTSETKASTLTVASCLTAAPIRL
jgi:hypothetical protein